MTDAALNDLFKAGLYLVKASRLRASNGKKKARQCEAASFLFFLSH